MIDKILPIALVLLLPGISMYANTDQNLHSGIKLVLSWLIISSFLYNIWYLVWYLWDFKDQGSYRNYQIKLALLTLGIVCFILFIYRFNIDFQSAYLVRIIFTIFLFILIQYTLKVQKNITQLQLEKEQIQTENYRAQLKALQKQVDPHFLFNSLNTLRSMIRQQHTNAERFVTSLGSFYRQTLKYNENTSLRLSKELEVLQSYLFLMKNRNENAISVDINIDESLYNHKLPTLALQMVVENCFKHNSISSKDPLHIKILAVEDYLIISNPIQPKIGVKEPSGYGLDLLTKRYALMGVTNGVLIEPSSSHFHVKLKLIT